MSKSRHYTERRDSLHRSSVKLLTKLSKNISHALRVLKTHTPPYGYMHTRTMYVITDKIKRSSSVRLNTCLIVLFALSTSDERRRDLGSLRLINTPAENREPSASVRIIDNLLDACARASILLRETSNRFCSTLDALTLILVSTADDV